MKISANRWGVVNALLQRLLAASLLLASAAVTAAPWSPQPGTTWYWQLQGTIKTTVNAKMYDIDLVDTPQATIDKLHAQGKVVICYFSAGTWENWRPDASKFPAAVKGRSNGWPGEKWLDIRKVSTLGPIMQARLDLAVNKRCDGVEPDNVDGYQNSTGFPLSAQDQLNYNRAIAQWAHDRGLSVGLKNDVDQVSSLVNEFDWALNEECFAYQECDALLPFVHAGKAVFGAEYSGKAAKFCPVANSKGFSTLKLPLNLDGSSRIDCLTQY